MATPPIKTKFEVDGEKEYKQALSSINSGLGVLNSEMTKTSALYKDNANSTEALTAKQDVLERTYLSQKDKVEELNKAHQNAAKQYGESDKRTQDWAKSLNKAEAQLYETEHAIKENDTALKKSTDSTKNFGKATDEMGNKTTGLGTMLDKLTSKFGISLPQGVKGSLDSMVKLNGTTALMAGGFIAVAMAIAAVEKKLIDLTNQQAAAADEIVTAAYVTGMSTDAIQEYRYAAELLDVSFETLTSSQSKMIRVMNDARDGTAAAQEAFNKLGVAYVDVSTGELRNAQDVFYDLIDSLGKIQNATERDATAMEVFGRSAQDLNPLIIQGSQVLRDYAKEAHDTGYVLDTEMLGTLGKVDDAYQRMKNSQETAKNYVALEFAPALEKFYDVAAEGVRNFGLFAKQSGLVNFFASILEIVSALAPAIEIIGALMVMQAPLVKALSVVLAVIADALTIIFSLVGGIIGLFTGNSGKYWDKIGNVLSGNDSATQRAVSSFNASGTDNWRGGMTWVGENGPEQVFLPQGSRVVTAQESGNSGDVYNITIDAKNVAEFNDIVRIAQNAKRTKRMGWAGE